MNVFIATLGTRGGGQPYIALACGPSVADDARVLERIRCAAVKVSDGDLDRLYEVVARAQADWRDLLMAAGFGHDPKAHERWFPGDDAR